MDGEKTDLYPHLPIREDNQVQSCCFKCLKLNKNKCFCFNLPMLAEDLGRCLGQKRFSTIYINSKNKNLKQTPNGAKSALQASNHIVNKSTKYLNKLPVGDTKLTNFKNFSVDEVNDYFLNVSAKVNKTYESNNSEVKEFVNRNNYSGVLLSRIPFLKPKLGYKYVCFANGSTSSQDERQDEENRAPNVGNLVNNGTDTTVSNGANNNNNGFDNGSNNLNSVQVNLGEVPLSTRAFIQASVDTLGNTIAGQFRQMQNVLNDLNTRLGIRDFQDNTTKDKQIELETKMDNIMCKLSSQEQGNFIEEEHFNVELFDKEHVVVDNVSNSDQMNHQGKVQESGDIAPKSILKKVIDQNATQGDPNFFNSTRVQDNKVNLNSNKGQNQHAASGLQNNNFTTIPNLSQPMAMGGGVLQPQNTNDNQTNPPIPPVYDPNLAPGFANQTYPVVSGTQQAQNFPPSNNYMGAQTNQQVPAYVHGGAYMGAQAQQQVPTYAPSNNYIGAQAQQQTSTYMPTNAQLPNSTMPATKHAQLNQTYVKTNLPNKSDWASLFFSTTANPAFNVVSNISNNDNQYSKEMILAPYEIGHTRKFRQFLIEFEQAASRCGQGEHAFPVMLAKYLQGKAKEFYNVFYSPGMSYALLKEQLIAVIEKFEIKSKFPSISDDIKYSSSLGAFGLMSALIKEVSDFGDEMANRRLAIEAFWQRLPPHLLSPMVTSLDTIKLLNGLTEPDLNCFLDAAMELDQNTELINKYQHNHAAQSSNVNPVPPPPPPSNNIGLGYINVSHGAAVQPGESSQLQAVANQLASTPGAQQGGQSSAGRGYQGNYRGSYRGNRGGYGSGSCGARGGLRGNYQGGSNYRGNGRGNFRGARGGTSKSCWYCENTSHSVQYCPKIVMKNRPTCSQCGQAHPRYQSCPQGASEKAQTGQTSAMAANASTIATNALQTSPAAPALTTSQSKSLTQENKNKQCVVNNKSTGLNREENNVINVINWSQFSYLDEMSDSNFENVPCEEVTLPFVLPSRKNNNFKPNKATFFIKDKPKDFEGELSDANSMFKRFQGNAKTVQKVQYPCESRTCNLAHHRKVKSSDGQVPVEEILDSLKEEFPLCTLAQSDSSNAQKIKDQRELRDLTDEQGVPVCTTMGSHGRRKKPIYSNEWCLEFQSDSEQCVLETKDKVFKIRHFQYEDPGLQAMGMKDLMLISIKVGDSGYMHSLLDTGASMSLVNSHLIDEIGGKWQLANTAIYGIGDKQGRQAIKSEPLKVTIGGIEMNPFSFYSIPNLVIGYDVILGRDFLSQNKIKLFPSIRKVKIGHKLSDGNRSTFCVYQKEIPSETVNDIVDDLTCIDVPCYLVNDVSLVADEVNTIQIIPSKDYIVDSTILDSDQLVSYLEIDPELAGTYPNMGVVHNNLDPQQVDILVSVDKFLPAGTKIGTFKTSIRDTLPEAMDNTWQPGDNAIYSIMTDQEVAEAVNSAKVDDKVCNNPTAILDEIQRFGTLPMKDTPPEYALGHHARIFPPRDMDLFMKQHEEWKANPVPDGIRDEWTMKRIKAEFEVPDGELTEDQKKEFYEMIHKYRVAFTRNFSDVHLATIGEIDLVLNDPEYHRLSVKPTRWSPEANKLIKEILDGYLKSGVIKHSSGPYSSRVFVVYRRACDEEPRPKPRLVIDYRNINRALVPCSKYLAGVDSLLLKVKNHKFYSKMDLKGAYHQVGIVEDKKDITSIVTVDSQFVFNVMSFGLSVAPGYFEIFMEHCFNTIPQDQLSHYLDDCIVPADSIQDMLIRIENFLYLIVKYRMKLSPSKCLFFCHEISFLGFILNEKGMKKSPEYVKRILDAPRPRTVHELMKFLGLVNFQRRFVPCCSEIIAPLNNAVEHKARNIKKKEIEWTDEMEQAFKLIKEELAKDVALAFPQTGPDAKELKLFVDASKIAIGSSLFQEQDGELRPISYVSKLLSKTELRYSSYDKEILGFVKGIVAHQQYLLGRKFVVYTDCKNVVYLYKMKNCCPRLLRLLEQLSGYDFTIEHVAGIENYVSDMMSRLTHFTDPEFYRKLTEHVAEDYIPDGLMELPLSGGPESPFVTISLLLKQVKDELIDPAKLRELLIAEILDNTVKYGVQGRPNDLQALRAMMKPGVATYVIVFKAAAEVFKVNFFIYFGIEQPLVFRPISNSNGNYPNVYVMCRGQGIHFNPLLDKNNDFETQDVFNKNNEEVGSESVLGMVNLLHHQEEVEDNTQAMAVLHALCTEKEEKKSMPNCCYSYQSAPMSKSIERCLPTLYLRKTRDPYLCPNKHSLGDFCLKLCKSQRSSAFRGAGDADRGCTFDVTYFCIGVDTGSSISLISDSAHQKLCDAGFADVAFDLQGLRPEESEIQVLDGTVHTLGFARISFPFWFAGPTMRTRHEFLVLPDEALSACILLGGDFLKKLDIKISCRDDKTIRYIPDEVAIKLGTGFEFSLKPLYNEIKEKQKKLEENMVACVRKRVYAVTHQEVQSPLNSLVEEKELDEEANPFSLQDIAELQTSNPEIRQLK